MSHMDMICVTSLQRTLRGRHVDTWYAFTLAPATGTISKIVRLQDMTIPSAGNSLPWNHDTLGTVLGTAGARYACNIQATSYFALTTTLTRNRGPVAPGRR